MNDLFSTNRLVFKSPEKSDGADRLKNVKESAQTQGETDEMTEKEKQELVAEYKKTKTYIRDIGEALDNAGQLLVDAGEGYKHFQALKKASQKFTGVKDEFSKMSLEDALSKGGEFTKDYEKYKEESEKKFAEFKETLLNDAGFERYVINNDESEKYVLELIYDIDKDAKKIIKIKSLVLGLGLATEGSYAPEETIFLIASKDKKSDEIIELLEFLSDDKIFKNLDERRAFFYYYKYYDLKKNDVPYLLKKMRSFVSKAKKAGAPPKHLRLQNILEILPSEGTEDEKEFSEDEVISFFKDLEDLPRFYVGEAVKQTHDSRKVRVLYGLVDERLSPSNVLTLLKLDGDAEKIVNYFKTLNGRLDLFREEKWRNQNFSRAIDWYNVEPDVVKVVDFLEKTKDRKDEYQFGFYEEMLKNPRLGEFLPFIDRGLTLSETRAYLAPHDGDAEDIVNFFVGAKNLGYFEYTDEIDAWYEVEKDLSKIIAFLEVAGGEKDFELLIEFYEEILKNPRLGEFLPYLGQGISLIEIYHNLSRLEGDPKEIVDYFVEAKKSGKFVNNYNILDWYSVEKDFSKVLDYLDRYGKIELKTDPIRTYGLKPSAEFLEDNIEFIKSLQVPGLFHLAAQKSLPESDHKTWLMKRFVFKKPKFTEWEAIMLASSFEPEKGFAADQYFSALAHSNTSVYKSSMSWLMARNKKKTPKLLKRMRKELKTKGSIYTGNTSDAFEFILDSKKSGTNHPHDIMDLWRVSPVAPIALELVEYASKHGFKLFRKHRKQWEGVGDAIGAIMFYAKDDPAKIAIYRHIFNGTSSIEHKNVESLHSDPSLPVCFEVYRKMRRQNPETALRVGRTLYFSGIDKANLDRVTPESIDETLVHIEKVQDKYFDMPLLEGRNVVLVGNSEIWEQNEDGEVPNRLLGKPRFVTPDLLEGIEASSPKTFKSFVPIKENGEQFSSEELADFKKDFLDYIKNTPPPLTVVFPGHGDKKSFHYYSGEIQGGRARTGGKFEYLSSKEFSDAITERAGKFGRDKVKEDIYVLDDCFGSNYIRDAKEKIEKSGIAPMPLLAAPAEYGQFGFSHYSEKRDPLYTVLGILPPGSGIFDKVNYRNNPPTVGDIIMRASGYKSSNYTLIAPDDDGKPAQIVEVDKKKRPKKRKAA
jgi:hypothetical protein